MGRIDGNGKSSPSIRKAFTSARTNSSRSTSTKTSSEKSESSFLANISQTIQSFINNPEIQANVQSALSRISKTVEPLSPFLKGIVDKAMEFIPMPNTPSLAVNMFKGIRISPEREQALRTKFREYDSELAGLAHHLNMDMETTGQCGKNGMATATNIIEHFQKNEPAHAKEELWSVLMDESLSSSEKKFTMCLIENEIQKRSMILQSQHESDYNTRAIFKVSFVPTSPYALILKELQSENLSSSAKDVVNDRLNPEKLHARQNELFDHLEKILEPTPSPKSSPSQANFH